MTTNFTNGHEWFGAERMAAKRITICEDLWGLVDDYDVCFGIHCEVWTAQLVTCHLLRPTLLG
jgi:hypothetical protein